jgi:hypothetical protein
LLVAANFDKNVLYVLTKNINQPKQKRLKQGKFLASPNAHKKFLYSAGYCLKERLKLVKLVIAIANSVLKKGCRLQFYPE